MIFQLLLPVSPGYCSSLYQASVQIANDFGNDKGDFPRNTIRRKKHVFYNSKHTSSTQRKGAKSRAEARYMTCLKTTVRGIKTWVINSRVLFMAVLGTVLIALFLSGDIFYAATQTAKARVFVVRQVRILRCERAVVLSCHDHQVDFSIWYFEPRDTSRRALTANTEKYSLVNNSVVVRNLSKSDEGMYRFQYHDAMNHGTCFVYLRIVECNNVSSCPGGNVTLNCSAMATIDTRKLSNPVMTSEWFYYRDLTQRRIKRAFNGTVLMSDNKYTHQRMFATLHTITIVNAKESDSGVYECHVTANGNRAERSKVILRVDANRKRCVKRVPISTTMASLTSPSMTSLVYPNKSGQTMAVPTSEGLMYGKNLSSLGIPARPLTNGATVYRASAIVFMIAIIGLVSQIE